MPFNLLDLIILLAIVAAIVRGLTAGLVRQFFSLSGFIGGLIVGAVVALHASIFALNPLFKGIIIIVIVLVVTALLSALGEFIGQYLAQKEKRLHLGRVDNALGGIFGAIMVLAGTWLIAGMLVGTPYQGLNQLINGSETVKLLDQELPPAPSILARLERTVDPNGFPQVFAGIEPAPTGPVTPATVAQVASAVAADRASTVKIQGYGCGGIVSGSGFVVRPGLVMTNAHVVAGIGNPVVIDDNGRHQAEVVEFDPNLDIAILKVSNLAGAPLYLASADATPGTQAIVLGYPNGGPFTAAAGGVIDERLATGRNIYNAGLTDREIYELQAIIQPGNSGGPLVAPDGTVLGIVFARSETNSNLGYALTSLEVLPRLNEATHATGSVSTGACASE
jgi:S1-C subfamily serine protease